VGDATTQTAPEKPADDRTVYNWDYYTTDESVETIGNRQYFGKKQEWSVLRVLCDIVNVEKRH